MSEGAPTPSELRALRGLQVDAAARAERAAADPERAAVTALLRLQRDGDPASGAGRKRKAKIDKWIRSELHRKEKAEKRNEQ